MEEFFTPEVIEALWVLITAVSVIIGSGGIVWVKRLKKLWDIGYPLYIELHNGSNLSPAGIASRILSIMDDDDKLPSVAKIPGIKTVEKAVLGAALSRAAKIEKDIGRHKSKATGHLNLIGNAEKAGLETVVKGDHVVFKSGAAMNYRTGKVDWNFDVGAKLF